MSAKSILIISCDPYLAGLYGRKFENDGWEVAVSENMCDSYTEIAKVKPLVILIQKDCCANIVDEVRKLRTLPGAYSMKIVVLSKETDRDEVAEARNAGADDYLLMGHFVAHEAVEKIKQMITK